MYQQRYKIRESKAIKDFSSGLKRAKGEGEAKLRLTGFRSLRSRYPGALRGGGQTKGRPAAARLLFLYRGVLSSELEGTPIQKKRHQTCVWRPFVCGGNRIRTDDPLLAKQGKTLYIFLLNS